jgi:hypothetical protein
MEDHLFIQINIFRGGGPKPHFRNISLTGGMGEVESACWK